MAVFGLNMFLEEHFQTNKTHVAKSYDKPAVRVHGQLRNHKTINIAVQGLINICEVIN